MLRLERCKFEPRGSSTQIFFSLLNATEIHDPKSGKFENAESQIQRNTGHEGPSINMKS